MIPQWLQFNLKINSPSQHPTKDYRDPVITPYKSELKPNVGFPQLGNEIRIPHSAYSSRNLKSSFPLWIPQAVTLLESRNKRGGRGEEIYSGIDAGGQWIFFSGRRVLQSELLARRGAMVGVRELPFLPRAWSSISVGCGNGDPGRRHRRPLTLSSPSLLFSALGFRTSRNREEAGRRKPPWQFYVCGRPTGAAGLGRMSSCQSFGGFLL